jgi:hypothetical protein
LVTGSTSVHTLDENILLAAVAATVLVLAVAVVVSAPWLLAVVSPAMASARVHAVFLVLVFK